MYTITVITHCGDHKKISMIDKEYAIFCLNKFLSAVDLAHLDMIDGLTGEVLYAWDNGEFVIIEGYTV